MTLTQLEYILAVDEFRHFNKAAKSCHVTQPTLSMQIQKLEDQLGVVIFDRSKTPIIPTMEGEKVLKQAKRVLREARAMDQVIASSKEELEGTFKVAVIPTLSAYMIPTFLGPFLEAHPKVHLEIEEAKTEDIIRYLEDDKIDAGLLVTPLHNDQILERSLYFEKFLVFAGNDHPYLKKKKIKESDLNTEDLWILDEGHCFRDQVLNICSANRVQSKKEWTFQSGNLETLKNLVFKMGGYTLLPEMASDSLPTAQKKFIREFSNPAPYREVSLVHSRLFHKERFIDELEKVIIDNIPSYLESNKKKSMEVVEIY